MYKTLTRNELIEMQKHFIEAIEKRDKYWSQLELMLPLVNTALEAISRADRLRKDIGTISTVLSEEYGDHYEVGEALRTCFEVLDKLDEDGYMTPESAKR